MLLYKIILMNAFVNLLLFCLKISIQIITEAKILAFKNEKINKLKENFCLFDVLSKFLNLFYFSIFSHTSSIIFFVSNINSHVFEKLHDLKVKFSHSFKCYFRGDEYKEHTKCITEDQKYGGKDYQAKPSSNKGEVKQEKWIEVSKNISFS